MKNQIFIALIMAIFSTLQAQNGVLNTGFNNTGKIDASYETNNSMCTDNNLKVLVLGHDRASNSKNIYVHRYTSAGVLDNTFGINGEFVFDLNSDYDYGRCIKSLNNGKYLVCGQNSVGPYFRAFIIRLMSNGSLDSSFGTNGIVIISPNQGNCDAWDMEISNSGSIYIAGYRTVGSVIKSALWKLKPDGSIDNSFGSNGEKVINTSAYSERLFGIDINNVSGQIAVTGTSGQGNLSASIVAMLDSNGIMSSSFNSSGYVIVSHNASTTSLYDVVLQSSQVVVVGNYSDSGKTKAVALSYLINGTLNSNFGNSGKFEDSYSQSASYSKVVENCNGELYLGGYSEINSKRSFRISKIKANGTLDNSFATNGNFVTRVRTSYDEAIEAMSLYGNSGLIFGGRTNMNGGSSRSGIVMLSVSSCETSSIETNSQVTNLMKLIAYPNPLRSGMSLQLLSNNINFESAEIKVFDFNGKLVYEGQYSDNDPFIVPSNVLLDKGFYFLRIENGGSKEDLKFLVQ